MGGVTQFTLRRHLPVFMCMLHRSIYLLNYDWILFALLFICIVSFRHLPKTNRSFVPLTIAFNLLYDLNVMHCQMQKTFKVCHRLVPLPRTQLNASLSMKKRRKLILNGKLQNLYVHTYSRSIRTGLVLPEVILTDLFTEGKCRLNLY